MEKDRKISALYSPYIIDGVLQDETPASMLEECRKTRPAEDRTESFSFDAITDETVDFPPDSLPQGKIPPQECLSLIRKAGIDNAEIDCRYPNSSTRLAIASAILQTLWREGHFSLGDLCIRACWRWNCSDVGSMAAFYKSAEAAASYIFELGPDLVEYTFSEVHDGCRAEFHIDKVREEQAGIHGVDDDFLVETPFESAHPWIGCGEKCSGTMIPDESSWIIYIPFDTCRFRLGGTALAKALGHHGGAAAEILDSDYFIDCYEVVRELAEDGIILAGTAAGRGGVMAALDSFCGQSGISIDINGIKAAYHEAGDMQILFGEVPGVIIQIADNDYDYVDSQLLLQDIAYFPLGHPSASSKGVDIADSTRPAISGILDSLLKSLASEGED